MPPPDPNAALIAEAARLTAQAAVATAETARINAAAAREKAPIQSLGLPTYEGKTVLNSGAGAIEALLLATDAVEQAAKMIAGAALNLHWPGDKAYAGDFLLLAGDEATDFSPLANLRAEMGIYAQIFAAVPDSSVRVDAAAGAIAAISAVAGLIRTETEVTAVDHGSISDRVLATAVAAQMKGRAVLPNAGKGGLPDAGNSRIFQGLRDLTAERDRTVEAVPELPVETAERLTAAVTRFDAFFARVTAPDSAGIVAVAQAALLEQRLPDKWLALRVHVEKAGGSLINRKNILTFFGFDPIRVSGGLVASYTILDPADGRVLGGGVLSCRTRVGKLSDIQSGGRSGL